MWEFWLVLLAEIAHGVLPAPCYTEGTHILQLHHQIKVLLYNIQQKMWADLPIHEYLENGTKSAEFPDTMQTLVRAGRIQE